MSDRFRFRIWNPDLQSYDDNRDYNVAILVNQDFGLVLNPYRDNIIEMCTGLKDKNGNLIYEGDILLLHNNKFEVGNNNITVFFKCLTDKYTHIDPMDFDYNESEIIGNIHEQAEQKE